MSVVLRDADTGSNSTLGASFTVPATVQSGDLMVATVEVAALSYTLATPTGWNQLHTSAGSSDGGSQFAALFTRRAEVGDAGATIMFEVAPTGTNKTGMLAAYRSDTAGQVVNVGISAYRAETTSGTTHVTPTINVAATPALLLAGIGKKSSSLTSITAPSGYTMVGTPHLTATCGSAFASAAASTTGNTSATWTTDASSQAATTFLMTLVEGDAPEVPPTLAPVFRRWNGAEWSLVE